MSVFSRSPAFFGGGGGVTTVVFTSSTLVGDLYTYMGSPTGPRNIQVIVDACDVGGLVIASNFNAGCTFQLTAINGGRFLGVGGNGGDGADDLGPTGNNGGDGYDGGHAVDVFGFDVNVDIDDGYMFGGGGGGGGGGFYDRGTDGAAGGGGGGGQGYGTSTGGQPGSHSTLPPLEIPDAGGNGSASNPGVGGEGGVTNKSNGAGGGPWGRAGGYGQCSSLGTDGSQRSGAGGSAGCAFKPRSGASITLNGSSTEAQLRATGRLIGEIQGELRLPWFLSPPNRSYVNVIATSGSSSETQGFIFENDASGTMTAQNTFYSNTDIPLCWYDGNPITPGDYEVRIVPDDGGLGLIYMDGIPTSAYTGMTQGTWYRLDVQRIANVTRTAPSQLHALFEIRRYGTADGLASSRSWLGVERETDV